MNTVIIFLTLVPCVFSRVEPLRIDGLVSAVFSPFDKNGDLDFSVVPTQAAYLKATNVSYAFVGGTTGESLSMTVAERKSLVEAWLKETPNVIAHCGCDSLRDAQELAAHAQAKGALAVAAMPPVFFKPANAHALALSIASICNNAPNLPCYYYHIPSMTGYTKPMLDFVMAIEGLSDNFAGIKYTGLYNNPGYMDVMRILAYKGGMFEVLSGREEMMLEGLAVGLKGHVGSQFNFAGDLYNMIRERFGQDGLTPNSAPAIRSNQLRGIELIAAWQTAPVGTNGAKLFMTFAGVPVGDARLPALPIAGAKDALQKEFADFCTNLGKDLYMCRNA